MNLEERVAYWTDFGITHYKDLYLLQQRLAELRLQNKIPDTILFSEHYPLISFGLANSHNKFNPKFLQKVKKIYGNDDEESAIKLLQDMQIDFFKTPRGGGATYMGPGQLIVYPIVDYYKIVNTEMGLDKYRSLLDKIMYEILRNNFNLSVDVVKVAEKVKEKKDSEMRKNRMDVWLNKNGKNYKIGAKGIHTNKNISYNGFSFYVKPYSLYGFDLILPCGYDHEELDVTCMENELAKQVDITSLKALTLEKIKEKFNYSSINYITPEELEKIEKESLLLKENV